MQNLPARGAPAPGSASGPEFAVKARVVRAEVLAEPLRQRVREAGVWYATALTLHRDAQTLAPTSYVLERINVGNDDARLITEGTWTTAVGSPVDERLAVAVLATAPPGFTRYLMLGANLLLVLDDKLEPRVGNALYSFTLSRTE